MSKYVETGSEASIGSIHLNNSGPYIYSADGYDITFRYLTSDGSSYGYASIRTLNNSMFKHINGYWSCSNNLNNINESGIGNTTSSYSNKPDDCDGWGTLVSFKQSNARGIQLLYGWNNNAYYLRSYEEASWESWKKIMFGTMSVSGTTLTITL